jgi:hypothetical protein
VTKYVEPQAIGARRVNPATRILSSMEEIISSREDIVER